VGGLRPADNQGPDAPRATEGTVPIVALDVASLAAARETIDALGGRCAFYKVGSELFTSVGPAAVELVRESGAQVFLDLKFHDIPNTVAGSVRAAAMLGASLLTVHASGGEEMLRAAVDAAGGECRVLAVTVLTSLGAAGLGEAWGREEIDPATEVDRLARIAALSGCHGIVCSGLEAARVRAAHGDSLTTLVPGIRLPGSAAGDQRRIVTPGDAARAGAGYIVVGRTVTAATDPAGAMDRVLADLAAAIA
jgi:orotidine-5'-phosphate decarboxylase